MARPGMFVVKHGRGGKTPFRAAYQQREGGGSERDLRVEGVMSQGDRSRHAPRS